MSLTVGVSIDSSRLRAVGLRGKRIVWQSERERGGATLASELQELLQPARELGRGLRLRAALGPSMAQTRVLSNVPPVRSRAALGQLIASEAGRFFVGVASGVATSGAFVDATERVWAEAYDRAAINAIGETCGRLRIRLEGVSSAARSLAFVTGHSEHRVDDGPQSVRVTCSHGSITEVSRRRIEATEASTLNTATVLPRAYAHVDPRYAIALGAALLPFDDPLQYRPAGDAVQWRIPAWRLRLAAVALTVSVVSALAAPVTKARLATRSAAAQLESLDSAWRKVVAEENALGAVERALDEIDAYSNERRSATRLLSSISTALPTSAAAVSLRVDSTEINLVGLADRVADVLSALGAHLAFGEPQLVGPVTREQAGDRQVERFTLRVPYRNEVSR